MDVNFTAAEQRELEQRFQKRQAKIMIGVFSHLVDHCFMSCIDDFTSKSLSARENGCITRCVQKQIAQTQRLAERFQEHSGLMQQQQAQQAQQFGR